MMPKVRICLSNHDHPRFRQNNTPSPIGSTRLRDAGQWSITGDTTLADTTTGVKRQAMRGPLLYNTLDCQQGFRKQFLYGALIIRCSLSLAAHTLLAMTPYSIYAPSTAPRSILTSKAPDQPRSWQTIALYAAPSGAVCRRAIVHSIAHYNADFSTACVWQLCWG